MTIPVSLDDEAVRLLRSLCGPAGIRASSSSTANYGAVFARDAIMAGIAGLLSGDPIISHGLARTLEQLRDLQGREGQIASNYELRSDAPPKVSFGTLVPRIDATTWYVIGVALAARAGVADPALFRDSVRSVIRLLDALEYNGRHLIYVPVGGNWADEYIYDGYVLHDQVLRAWALRLAAGIFDEPGWRDKADRVEKAIESTFWPQGDQQRYPLAAVSPARVHDVFDLATCSLLAVSGIAPRLAGRALDHIVSEWLSRGKLPPAFHPVITESHVDWPALRRYHLHGFRNRPHEYHNGGVWPIWLGWLAVALARTERRSDLQRLEISLSAALGATTSYAFEEFLHGETLRAGGMQGMAYSATGLVFLRMAQTRASLALLDS